MKTNTVLFITGLVQVFFVAANTYFLANKIYLAVFVSAFMISIVWSYNVKKIVFGSLPNRISYAIGAATGSITGLYISNLIINIYAK
jgi:hypothetical protein